MKVYCWPCQVKADCLPALLCQWPGLPERINTRWLFTTGICSLAGLEERCPKSSCLQGLLLLKIRDKHFSVTFPGFCSLCHPWHSFPGPIDTTLQPVPSFYLPFFLVSCVSVSSLLLRRTLASGFRAHLIQHDLILTNSFGKILFPIKVTLCILRQTFFEGRGSLWSLLESCSMC